MRLVPETLAKGRCQAAAGFRQCSRKARARVQWNAGMTADLCRQHAGRRPVLKELVGVREGPKSPEEILCRRCGAKPGVMCRTRKGNTARYWHGRRHSDWEAIK